MPEGAAPTVQSMTDVRVPARVPRTNYRHPPDPVQQHKRRLAYLRKVYKLSGSEFDALALRSGGLCGGCGRQLRNPCVDYDHSAQVVRGLLCLTCIVKGTNRLTTPRSLRVRAHPPDD